MPARVAGLSLPTGGIVAEVLVNGGRTGRCRPDARAAGLGPPGRGRGPGRSAIATRPGRPGRAEGRRPCGRAPVGAGRAGCGAGPAGSGARTARCRPRSPLPKPSLAEAQAAQRKTLEGADEQQIIAAQAEALNAAAAVQPGAGGLRPGRRAITNIGLRPEALQLEHATNAYNAAQARLTQLKKGASPADIAAARARVQRAQAQLDLLTAVNPADVAAAEAEVRRAQAQLDLLAADPRPEAIAAAEAEMRSRAGCAGASQDHPGRNRADGTVCRHRSRRSTLALASTSVPESRSSQLADLTSLQIETDDLTELNVVRVPGRRAGDRHLRRAPRPHANRQSDPHQAAGRKQAGRHDLHRGDPARSARCPAALEHDRGGGD